MCVLGGGVRCVWVCRRWPWSGMQGRRMCEVPQLSLLCVQVKKLTLLFASPHYLCARTDLRLQQIYYWPDWARLLLMRLSSSHTALCCPLQLKHDYNHCTGHCLLSGHKKYIDWQKHNLK